MTTDESVSKKYNLAYIGFYLSIVSLFISFYGLISLLSVILCFTALVRTNPSSPERKIAVIGVVLSIVSLAYAYIMLML